MIDATAFRGPEVLHVVDEPVPAPGPGEVTIEVRAAAVNPIDYKIYSGLLGRDPATLPQRVGMELAGVVTTAGPGAPFAAGGEVIAYRRDMPARTPPRSRGRPSSWCPSRRGSASRRRPGCCSPAAPRCTR